MEVRRILHPLMVSGPSLTMEVTYRAIVCVHAVLATWATMPVRSRKFTAAHWGDSGLRATAISKAKTKTIVTVILILAATVAAVAI